MQDIRFFHIYILFLNNPKLDDDKKGKYKAISPLGFIVLGFLSLSGMFNGIPSLLQYLPSVDRTITKRVTSIFQNRGRASTFNGFEVTNSYFYGRVNTDKKVAESLHVGDSIIFYGQENMFGFYSNQYEIEKNSINEMPINFTKIESNSNYYPYLIDININEKLSFDLY